MRRTRRAALIGICAATFLLALGSAHAWLPSAGASLQADGPVTITVSTPDNQDQVRAGRPWNVSIKIRWTADPPCIPQFSYAKLLYAPTASALESQFQSDFGSLVTGLTGFPGLKSQYSLWQSPTPGEFTVGGDAETGATVGRYAPPGSGLFYAAQAACETRESVAGTVATSSRVALCHDMSEGVSYYDRFSPKLKQALHTLYMKIEPGCFAIVGGSPATKTRGEQVLYRFSFLDEGEFKRDFAKLHAIVAKIPQFCKPTAPGVLRLRTLNKKC